jgi:hypothetical protein
MSETAEVQYSEDGNYWWDGNQWQPVDQSQSPSSSSSAAGGASGSDAAGGDGQQPAAADGQQPADGDQPMDWSQYPALWTVLTSNDVNDYYNKLGIDKQKLEQGASNEGGEGSESQSESY